MAFKTSVELPQPAPLRVQAGGEEGGVFELILSEGCNIITALRGRDCPVTVSVFV